jgi:hypothetical protein
MDIETPSGHVVSLDQEDYDNLQWKSISMSSNGYAQIFHDGKVRTLHSVIMGVGDGTGYSVIVDHVDQNKLNNRRSNLRLVNPTQSNLNIKDRTRKEPLPRNVYRNRRGFLAQVQRYGKRSNLGTFPTPELAAEAVARFKEEND